MERLITDLLDLSCIEAGKLSIVRKPHSLKELLKDAVRSVFCAGR